MEDFIYQEQIITCLERSSPRRRRNNKILPPECHQSIFNCQYRISPRRQRGIDCENLTSVAKVSEPLGLKPLERRQVPQISEGYPRSQVFEEPKLISVTTVVPEEVVTEEVVPEGVISEQVISEEIVSEEVVSEEVVPEGLSPEEIIPEEVIPPGLIILPVTSISSITTSVPLPPVPSTFSIIRSLIAPVDTTAVQNIERQLPRSQDLMFHRDFYVRRNEPIPLVVNLVSLTNSILRKSEWTALLGNIPGRIKPLPDQGMPDMIIPRDILPFIPAIQSKEEMVQIRGILAEADRLTGQLSIDQSAEILSFINRNTLSLDNFLQTGSLLASFPNYAIPVSVGVINAVNNSISFSKFAKILSTVSRINLNDLQLNIADTPISRLISNNIIILQYIENRVGLSAPESRQEEIEYQEIDDDGGVDVMTISNLQLGMPVQRNIQRNVQRDIQGPSRIFEMVKEMDQIPNLLMPSIQDIVPDQFGIIIQEDEENDSRAAEFMQVFQDKLMEIFDIIQDMKLEDLMKETIQIGLGLIALHDNNYRKIFGDQDFYQDDQSSALQLIYATMFAQLKVAIEFINVMICQYINIHILMTAATIICNFMKEKKQNIDDIIMCLKDPEDPQLTSFAHSLLYSLVNMVIINNVYLKSLHKSFSILVEDYINKDQNDLDVLKFYRDNQFLNHAVYCSLIYISFMSAEEEVREWSRNLNNDLEIIRENIPREFLGAVREFFRDIGVYTEDFRRDIKRLLDINLLLVPNLIQSVEMSNLKDSSYLRMLEKFIGRSFNI